jgi:phosphoesterase RecJ-like protein
MDAMGITTYLNKEIAECLYVGIMTDTGSFKYASTTAKTHHIIAELITAGAENTKIHDLIYDNSSANRIKLLGYCLNEKLRLYPENNTAIISLTDEELKRFEFKKGDTEGIVNYALAIKGIKFAVFIAEKDGIVKLSLRSKGDFKVNEIANKYFSGGGHMNAAGGMSEVSVNKTIKKLEKIINDYKNELNNQN